MLAGGPSDDLLLGNLSEAGQRSLPSTLLEASAVSWDFFAILVLARSFERGTQKRPFSRFLSQTYCRELDAPLQKKRESQEGGLKISARRTIWCGFLDPGALSYSPPSFPLSFPISRFSH